VHPSYDLSVTPSRRRGYRRQRNGRADSWPPGSRGRPSSFCSGATCRRSAALGLVLARDNLPPDDPTGCRLQLTSRGL